MSHSASSGRRRTVPVLLLLVVFLALLSVPMTVRASESCSMLGGNCRDACSKSEKPEAGDFEDCGAKQECCLVFVETPVRCCVGSLDAKNYGPANCSAPVNGACSKGSGSPAPCEKLQMCATVK